MKLSKRIISIILSLTMIIGLVQMPMTASAATSTTTANQLINDLILYYRDYQDAASTDIQRVLEELKTVDEQKYEEWKQIMEYWAYVNTDMTVNTDTSTVTDLPTDDSLCIVILGYALNSDGTMKEELIGRLTTGLELANQYPNAYVAVTGGGTAANNPDVTEGGLMGDWLLEQGLDESRLIVEDKAPNTVGNALNTYNILRESYPNVDSICLVTSDYHVPRGCLLFYSKCLIAAYEAKDQFINVVSNAGYVTGTSGYENIGLQATGLASVADISLSGSVTLSEVVSLTVTMNEAYVTGEELDLTVTANYDTGYSKDVTDAAVITGFDPTSDENQTINISYTENDVTVGGSFTLSENSKVFVATGYLESLITDVEALDSSAYTEESMAVLNTAVANAKELLETEGYSVTDVKAAYDEVMNAYYALRKILNVAYQKTVTASCNQDEAVKIVDGSTSNYWTSKDSNGDVAIADSYFIIDLDGVYELDNIHVTPYNGNNRYYHYDVQISTDGEEWTTVVEHRSTEACTSAGNVHEMEDGTYARYVKVVGVLVYRPDKTIINFHVKEVAVYGVEVDNIALGRPVTSSGTDTSASSSVGSSERTVIDGDRTTYWDGGKYSSRPWVTVDLGGVYKLDRVNVINYWKSADRYYQYEVYTSVDGINFVQLGAKTDTNIATIQGETYECTEDVYAAYIKVVGTYNSKNSAFHINELRAYGEVANEEEYQEYLHNIAKAALEELVAECEDTYKDYDYTEDTWAVYETQLQI